jgi:hypothetical protein
MVQHIRIHVTPLELRYFMCIDGNNNKHVTSNSEDKLWLTPKNVCLNPYSLLFIQIKS